MQIFLVDSISAVTFEMHGQIVVSGSHGGVSAAHLALAHPPAFVVFNDAGVGLDGAGIRGLNILQSQGVAACTVSHLSARIGEARSTLESGVITHVNTLASVPGIRAKNTCAEAINFFLKSFLQREKS